jgi:hypothetical protein
MSSSRRNARTRTSSLALLVLFFGLLVGCSPDAPTSLKLTPPAATRSALLQAPSILAQAEAGTLGRGEQDYLVRFERRVPGFGGLFIQNGQIYIYLKGPGVSQDSVRSVLARTYAAHQNKLVREVMAAASHAIVLPADYSFSELIAVEQRIASASRLPSAFVGAGVSLRDNRVTVAVEDSASVSAVAGMLAANGVPVSSLTLTVWGRPHFLSVGQWIWPPYRPTNGGPQIAVGNDTRAPKIFWPYENKWKYWYELASLGYNVRSSSGVDYMLTAAHTANVLSATVGAVGDSVWQPMPSDTRQPGPIGKFTVNPAWSTNCRINPVSGVPYDYCTTADVALMSYFPGITYNRKVGTSVTGGVYGDGKAGSADINGWQNIVNVFPPEYVDNQLHKDAAKSGWATGTTSGPITLPMYYYGTQFCLDPRWGCTKWRWLLVDKIAVVAAVHGGGDSGAPVFSPSSLSNNGAPYAALGILFAGDGGGRLCTGDPCRFYFSRW